MMYFNGRVDNYLHIKSDREHVLAADILLLYVFTVKYR